MPRNTEIHGTKCHQPLQRMGMFQLAAHRERSCAITNGARHMEWLHGPSYWIGCEFFTQKKKFLWTLCYSSVGREVSGKIPSPFIRTISVSESESVLCFYRHFFGPREKQSAPTVVSRWNGVVNFVTAMSPVNLASINKSSFCPRTIFPLRAESKCRAYSLAQSGRSQNSPT